MDVREITVEDANTLIAQGSATFVDVRDPWSYEEGHIPGAIHVNDGEVDAFVSSADKTRPLVVYCYHGFSSIGGAAYFAEQGFTDVASMSGGFEAWRAHAG